MERAAEEAEHLALLLEVVEMALMDLVTEQAVGAAEQLKEAEMAEQEGVEQAEL
jgi:hypothetical protein